MAQVSGGNKNPQKPQSNSQTNNSSNNNQQTSDPGKPVITTAPNTIRVNAQVSRPDTFNYVIGRSEFRLVNANEGDYIKVFPHGATIKKNGGGRSKGTLIAPVNLPVGAKIINVRFNYIVLPQSGAVPHLVLRSHYVTSSGGYGINTPITSYWLTSGNLNNTNGYYNVQASGTSAGFNVGITKGSTHYFEILAGSAQSTITPQQSDWPDNEKIFIWSIDVQYTMYRN